ncbi:spermatogenesis-associated serine-rich protein 1 [Aplysia californica]|uniref:Spermatogenesis-associated serine-rich protein 1 n=1 Tax=Aplysia californica TaxID=6500 RepID=A0ABM0JNQ6_APLCA|nr:spermatogenesis-associated serine-rich protein 1 [Aplysia californica]
MLHVTTEIGKPGKKEREKRHFPELTNQPGVIPAYKPRGRRYISHNNGREDEWRPHNQSIDVEYTEAGPDWSSRLKYIPHPENPEYPAAEIWPNNWRSMRPYPFTYKRSNNEWLLDPGLTKVGLRCMFEGVHKATATSVDEINHSMMFGKGRNEEEIDKRNSLTEASPGDKSYQVPEYSPSFHKPGSGNSVQKFSMGNSPYAPVVRGKPDTFVPLVPLPQVKRESYPKKTEGQQRQEDIEAVKKLDTWLPAKPIATTIPQLDPSEVKKY